MKGQYNKRTLLERKQLAKVQKMKFGNKVVDLRVDAIKPMIEGPYLEVRGTTLYANFHEYFNIEEDQVFNTFSIGKQSYSNDIDRICHYMNYFMKYYDDKNELLLSLYKIKFSIDSNTEYPYELFKRDIFNNILTPTTINNIKRLVNYNYYISLVKKDFSTNDKYKYRALEFDDYHGMILHCMSMTCKILAPIINHYYEIEGGLHDEDKVTEMLIDIFLDVPKLFSGVFDTYNKLYTTTRSKIIGDHRSESSQWATIRRDGIDSHLEVENMTHKLFVETFLKAKFEKNILSFIHSMLKIWINATKNKQFKFNYHHISKTDGNEDLSTFDKMEISNIKFDESVKIHATIIVNELIDNLEKQLNFKCDEDSDEFKFYEEHVDIEKFQRNLILLYFSKYSNPLYLELGINYKRTVKLIMLMKRMLKSQSLFLMPVILTSIPDKLNGRSLNKKDSNNIINSSMFDNILKMKYSTLGSVLQNSEVISVFINQLINTKYYLVDFEHKDELYKEKEFTKEILQYEVLKFIELL